MFPKDSAFTHSAETLAHMERVRDRALSGSDTANDLSEEHKRVREALVKEAEQLAEEIRNESSQQLRHKMDR